MSTTATDGTVEITISHAVTGEAASSWKHKAGRREGPEHYRFGDLTKTLVHKVAGPAEPAPDDRSPELAVTSVKCRVRVPWAQRLWDDAPLCRKLRELGLGRAEARALARGDALGLEAPEEPPREVAEPAVARRDVVRQRLERVAHGAVGAQRAPLDELPDGRHALRAELQQHAVRRRRADEGPHLRRLVGREGRDADEVDDGPVGVAELHVAVRDLLDLLRKAVRRVRRERRAGAHAEAARLPAEEPAEDEAEKLGEFMNS